ncbi:MAG TPA: hypothetical protein VFH73_10075 [Polyangia bacterium]|jgi:hypothetical protein|nr:hypothetical protein [Polyangia bacterium]
MNITIPPILFYALGALLVVFGTLRAWTLGRRRSDRELEPDTPARVQERKRHLTFGIVWVAMGLFLIVSTLGVIKMRGFF